MESGGRGSDYCWDWVKPWVSGYEHKMRSSNQHLMYPLQLWWRWVLMLSPDLWLTFLCTGVWLARKWKATAAIFVILYPGSVYQSVGHLSLPRINRSRFAESSLLRIHSGSLVGRIAQCSGRNKQTINKTKYWSYTWTFTRLGMTLDVG